MVRARADRNRSAETGHVDGRRGIDGRAVAELADEVAAPASNNSGTQERARVLASGPGADRRGTAQSRDRNGRIPVTTEGAVAELAVTVAAPAIHGLRREERAREVVAGRDGADDGTTAHRCWCRSLRERSVAELAGTVRTPAVGGRGRTEHRARVVSAGGESASRGETRHQNRRGRVGRAPVSQLTQRVVAPTARRAADGQRAGVRAARTDRDRVGHPSDVHRQLRERGEAVSQLTRRIRAPALRGPGSQQRTRMLRTSAHRHDTGDRVDQYRCGPGRLRAVTQLAR